MCVNLPEIIQYSDVAFGAILGAILTLLTDLIKSYITKEIRLKSIYNQISAEMQEWLELKDTNFTQPHKDHDIYKNILKLSNEYKKLVATNFTSTEKHYTAIRFLKKFAKNDGSANQKEDFDKARVALSNAF